VAFGGAGPLHACALAEALDMAAVVVPAHAGVLCAVGLLTSPRRRDLVRSWPDPAGRAGLADALAALGAQARALVGEGAEVLTALDCRYAGQSHELTVPTVDAFHAEHRARNGFDRPDAPIEVVALRATARLPAPVEGGALPVPERPGALGPAVISEPDCTVWVPDGWRAEPGEGGALVLRRA
jgi:N-methylhydantoinase A/oxoprolinase/acetone carboxylase beta subunit